MPGQGCEQGIPVGQMLRVHNVEKWRTRPSLSRESIVGPAGMFGVLRIGSTVQSILTAEEPAEAMQWQAREAECRTVSHSRNISITLGYIHITQDLITVGLLCQSPFPLITKESQRLQFLNTVSLKITFSTADQLF